ncbi:hypothetical protein PM10SUCC1_27630 [Propionigenium maris DSM 9537]|uniref:DUF871 domain-containing protein n=2 Tax=Propionigenium TaxID=2332 RepID=A0A9W6GLE7_9FUSO|nr:hypothetical protein PM10SUCC1_27630 [Propionigenium maris DSM 9537]
MGVDKMYGVSVFPGMGVEVEKKLKYMERAAEGGGKYLFTSPETLEANSETGDSELAEIVEKARSLGMTVILQISKKDFERYEWSRYGEFIFRVSRGFTGKEIVALSKDYRIQLDAGTMHEEVLEELMELGVSPEEISMGYDCYPRRDTGISIELLRERNKVFKRYGMEVMAFVGSQNKRMGPLFEGMPTVEAHRNLNILVGTQELLAEGCDVVLIGDTMASGKELRAIGEITEGEWLLPTKGYPMSSEEREIFEGFHRERIDQGEYVVRSRNLSEEGVLKEIPQKICSERKAGSVTIDNCLYGRYQGELQIVKRNLSADERVNVVGRVEDRGRLLNRIKPGDRFRLYKINK